MYEMHKTMSDDAAKAYAVMDAITQENVATSGEIAYVADTNDMPAAQDSVGQDSVEQQPTVKTAEDIYNEVAGHNNKAKLDALMEKAGVKPEDFQAVCDEHPEMIQQIGGGPTCTKLADAANRVKDELDKNGHVRTGKCLQGAQKIYSAAGVDSLSCAQAQDAQKEFKMQRPYQGNANGGCSGYYALEHSGDFITVSVPNKAYNTSTLAEGNRAKTEMNALFQKVQPGVTITVDDIRDKNVRNKLSGRALYSASYGHITVKRSNSGKYFASDFLENNIGFNRYGEYAHACFPKDASISQEYAKMVIAKAQERQARENQQSNTQQMADSQQTNTSQQNGTSQTAKTQQTGNQQQSAATQYAMNTRMNSGR